MVMTKINGKYNLIAKDMEPKEFTEELSSLIQTMADDLDNDEDWECTEVSEEQTYYDIIYHFTTYTRKNPVEM